MAYGYDIRLDHIRMDILTDVGFLMAVRMVLQTTTLVPQL